MLPTAITCPPLNIKSEGLDISPQFCTNASAVIHYASECRFSCKSGYQHHGPGLKTCNQFKNWYPSGNPSCKGLLYSVPFPFQILKKKNQYTIPLWLRYVDDTFTAVHKDEIDDFHKHLNEQHAGIQFTREIEEDGKLPFLDCLVSHDNNELHTTVYRKPTHTDRLLDESSYNPTSHNATTIKTLTRRAKLVCDTTDSLSDENKYLDRVFYKNNYNADFVRGNTHRTTETTETNKNPTFVTTATIPYIKGTSETIARILQPYDIRVAHKPITTLRHLLTNVKDRDEPNNRQGAVYKIKCSDCQASYIGETGRSLDTRLTEHKRATRNGDVNNHISEHHRLTNHKIERDSAEILTYSTNYFQRLTLESWYTNLEQTPINRCQQLPAPYKRLINDINKTDEQTTNRTT